MTDPKLLSRLHASLRAKFERRDRLAKQLAGLDQDIADQVRALGKAEGVLFMRPESARQIVFAVHGEERSNAS